MGGLIFPGFGIMDRKIDHFVTDSLGLFLLDNPYARLLIKQISTIAVKGTSRNSAAPDVESSFETD